MAADGDILVVGARGVRGHHGRVIVYERLRSRDDGGGDSNGDGGSGWGAPVTLSPPDWTDEPGPGGVRIRNNFGVAVAVGARGSLIAVGSTGYRTERGAVYLYERPSASARGGAAASWACVQRLVSGDPVAYGFFGWKVAVGGGGGSSGGSPATAVVAVGADGEGAYRGAVYVYERRGRGGGAGGSGRVAALPSAAPGDPADALATGPYGRTAALRRAGGAAEDNFGGGGLALSAAGDVLAVGAPGVAGVDGRRDAGAVVVYHHQRRRAGRGAEGGGWGGEGTRGDVPQGGSSGGWHAAAAHTLGGAAAASAPLFGWDVALSGDAAVLVASSPDARGGEGLVWTAPGRGGAGGGWEKASAAAAAASDAAASAAASATRWAAAATAAAAVGVADAGAVVADAVALGWGGMDAAAGAVRAGAARLLAAVAKEEL